MSISVRDLEQVMLATLGNREDGAYDFLGLVNEWTWAFFTLHPWAFQERPLKQVDFVAGQEWVSLPTDFGQLISAEATGGLVQRVERTTQERIAYMRTTGVGPIAGNTVFYVAVEHAEPNPGTDGLTTPRLAVYQTPSSNITNALTICYIAGAPDLTSDNAYLPVPVWIRACFLQGWRHYLRGIEEEDTAPMGARMTSWLGDPITQAAMQYDGGVQQNIGQLRGGAATLGRHLLNYDGLVT